MIRAIEALANGTYGTGEYKISPEQSRQYQARFQEYLANPSAREDGVVSIHANGDYLLRVMAPDDSVMLLQYFDLSSDSWETLESSSDEDQLAAGRHLRNLVNAKYQKAPDSHLSSAETEAKFAEKWDKKIDLYYSQEDGAFPFTRNELAEFYYEAKEYTSGWLPNALSEHVYDIACRIFEPASEALVKTPLSENYSEKLDVAVTNIFMDWNASLGQSIADKNAKNAVQDYETWYNEALSASNEAGCAFMSVAETIRYLSAELEDLRARLREVHSLSENAAEAPTELVKETIARIEQISNPNQNVEQLDVYSAGIFYEKKAYSHELDSEKGVVIENKLFLPEELKQVADTYGIKKPSSETFNEPYVWFSSDSAGDMAYHLHIVSVNGSDPEKEHFQKIAALLNGKAQHDLCLDDEEIHL